MNLREKTIDGVTWSFIDSLASQGLYFIIGIILARILSPREFGLIGMITIFVAISQTFIDSGFSSALIRKQNCTQADYSTVFYFNLFTGLLLFLVIFFSAPIISKFFGEPELIPILQVLGIVLIVESLTIIQRTILIKRVDFKLQARISIISSVFSGMIAITLALNNYGVWSLVFLQIIRRCTYSVFLWLWNKWKPMFVFSKRSFNELFGFGSKLLISSLIETAFRNVYLVVIGKYFSAQTLGYYTRATEFTDFPSQNITSVISRVTYPVLSQLQNDLVSLKSAYKRIIKTTMLITFIMMIGLAAVAEPLVHVLIGEKWHSVIIYLQMLTFIGMMYPLHSLNLNMLNVNGRSDLFLRLEVIKKILVVPTIIVGVFYGIEIMLMGMWIVNIIAYFLNSYWSGFLINYPIKEQINDIYPSFLMASFMGICIYMLGLILPLNYFLTLVLQLFVGSIIVFSLLHYSKSEAYLELKQILIFQLKRFFTYAK